MTGFWRLFRFGMEDPEMRGIAFGNYIYIMDYDFGTGKNYQQERSNMHAAN